MSNSTQTNRAAPTHSFSSLCHSPPSYPSIILAYITDQNGKPIDPSKPRPVYLRTASGKLFERNSSCKPPSSTLKRPASPNSSSQPSHSPPSNPHIILAYITDQTGKPIEPNQPHPEYRRTASGELFERSPACTPHSSTLKHKNMDVGVGVKHAGPEKQVEVVKRSVYTVSVEEKGRRSCVVLVSSVEEEEEAREEKLWEGEVETDIWAEIAEEEVLVVRRCCAVKDR